jgi:hypothetical protein
MVSGIFINCRYLNDIAKTKPHLSMRNGVLIVKTWYPPEKVILVLTFSPVGYAISSVMGNVCV